MLEVEAIDHGEEKRPFGFRWTAKVICLNCFASCGTHGFQHNEEDGKRMAIRAWNRRVNDDRQKAEIEKYKKKVDDLMWDLPPIGGFHDD